MSTICRADSFKRRAVSILFLIAVFLLTGCMNEPLRERTDTWPLPSARPGPAAPKGDAQSREKAVVTLFVPDRERSRLAARTDTVDTQAGVTLESTVAARLLDVLTPMYPSLSGQSLRLSQTEPTVERAGNVVMVNLGYSMRLLSPREQFTVRAALTNTLAELGGISRVGVLINGREDGSDIASTNPVGLLPRISEGDIDSYWNQLDVVPGTDITRVAALYYPCTDGIHILAESRAIAFSSADSPDGFRQSLIEGVLRELTAGSAVYSSSTVTLMPPDSYLVYPPRAYTPSGSADNLVELSFRAELDDYLAVRGGNRASFFASLTYTLTGFVPGLDGVIIHVGGKPVTDLAVSDEQSLNFENGRMNREDFDGFSAGLAVLYFPTADGRLVRVVQPIARRLTGTPRELLRLLLQGSPDGSIGIIPGARYGDEEILGVSINGDTALVNVSEVLADACGGLSEEQTRGFLYAVVNTLTELRGVRRVRFYVQGEEREFLNEPYSSVGEFFRNPGIVINAT